jgi:membrane-associated phospholipid phosphatase
MPPAPAPARVATSGTASSSGAGWHAAVRPFDDRIEALADRLRGRRVPDLLFSTASTLGDHGALWVLVAAWQARRPGPRRTRAIRALAVAGFASLAVNTSLKRWAGRERPASDDSAPTTSPVPVRTPTGSSFPSGHTLAGWCAATTLAESAGAGALLYAMAALVGLSRVHLRAHHASDVVAGAAVGTVVGMVGRRLSGHRSSNRHGGMPAPGAWFFLP